MGAFVGIAAVGIAIFKAKLQAEAETGGSSPSFKTKPMLSPNELEFLNRLDSAVPKIRFCPRVTMGRSSIPLSRARTRAI